MDKYLKGIIIQFIILVLGLWFCYYVCPDEIGELFEEDTPNFLAIIGILWALSSFVQLSTSWEIWILNVSIGIIVFIVGAYTVLEGFFMGIFAAAIFLGFVAYLLSAFNTGISAVLMIIALIMGGIGWKFRNSTEPTDEKARIEKREDREFEATHTQTECGLWYDNSRIIKIKHKVYRKGYDIIEVDGQWKIVPDDHTAIKYCGKWHAIPDNQSEIRDDDGNLIAKRKASDGIWLTPDGDLYDGGWFDYGREE